MILMGTVVNNGIVFVDYVNQLRMGGMAKRSTDRNRKNKDATNPHDRTHNNTFYERYGIFTGCRKCNAERNGGCSRIRPVIRNTYDIVYRSGNV